MSALKKLNNSQFQRYGQSGNTGSRTHPPVRERINRLDEVMRKRGY
jgi:Zn-dependent protease with chaperone function